MIKHSLAAIMAISLSAGAAQAQIPFTIEGRADRAVPMGDFDDLVDAGFSVGAAASVQLRPGLGVYASYNHAVFGPKLVGDADDAEDKGVSLGLTAAIPTGTTRVRPYVAAGVVAHQFKLFNEVEAEEEIGFEVGAGLAVPLIGRLRLTPSVSFRSYNVDPQFNTDGNPVPQPGDEGFAVRYFAAGVGLNLAF